MIHKLEVGFEGKITLGEREAKLILKSPSLLQDQMWFQDEILQFILPFCDDPNELR